MNPLSALLAYLGASSMETFRVVGRSGLVAARTLTALPQLNWRECVRATVLFGYHALPLALGVAALTGSTVILQTSIYVQRFGIRQYTGWAGGYAVLWEFGPLLLGLLMGARIGARNAAELALMEVGGQIEGLRGISLDPFRLLVAPRVLAALISIGALATITFITSIIFECSVAYAALDLPPRIFFTAFSDLLSWKDLVAGLVKSASFGVAISVISTGCGLAARGGAEGVGRATAQAVVSTSFALFLLDFILTPLLAAWAS